MVSACGLFSMKVSSPVWWQVHCHRCDRELWWARACQRPSQDVGEDSAIEPTTPQNFPVTIMTQSPFLPRRGLLGQTPPRSLETAKVFYLFARKTGNGIRVAAVQRNTLPGFNPAQKRCQGLVRHQPQSDNRNEKRKAKPQH